MNKIAIFEAITICGAILGHFSDSVPLMVAVGIMQGLIVMKFIYG